jgi:KaiC/GvpD/RAD55 family RecA-like ATPase
MSKNELSGIDLNEVNEYNIKKQEVQRARIRREHEQLQEQKLELERLEELDLSLGNNKEYALELSQETEDYLLRARKSKVFLNNDFRGKIPFFARNIILCAAETGGGKSTISANLTYQAILQGQSILVFSNEENPGDVYNRITCLIYGWFYANHEKFTDEQIKTFKENIVTLSERITVIGDTYQERTGCTTTIEGIESACNSLIKKKIHYDLIIFDYYQNINRSVNNPGMADWQVQYRFCKFLDQYKNKSNSCLVVLSQKKASKDKELPFQESLEGRKSIMTVATCAINIVKDIANFCTLFEIKKSRFNDCVGDTIRVGFDKGKYVTYDQEFKSKALSLRADKENKELMAKVNPGGLK